MRSIETSTELFCLPDGGQYNAQKVFKGFTKGAAFSQCQTYRYLLWRNWDKGLPSMMTVGVNPSTADAKKNDATIDKLVKFAKRWGYGRLMMVNLFAFRARDPWQMLHHNLPVGPENDDWITLAADHCELILVAWGNPGKHMKRDRIVLDLLRGRGRELYHLGLNLNKTPKHPLYRKDDTQPILLT